MSGAVSKIALFRWFWPRFWKSACEPWILASDLVVFGSSQQIQEASLCEVRMWILHWFYRCFSTPDGVAEASSCAMSGPSWGYLRRTWELFGSTLGHIVQCKSNLERTWRLFVSTFCYIAHAKWQCWIYTGFSNVFYILLMAESSSCEMSGLSWGYPGRTLGLLGSILGASCAMLGQSWANLEATWFNFVWHSPR